MPVVFRNFKSFNRKQVFMDYRFPFTFVVKGNRVLFCRRFYTIKKLLKKSMFRKHFEDNIWKFALFLNMHRIFSNKTNNRISKCEFSAHLNENSLLFYLKIVYSCVIEVVDSESDFWLVQLKSILDILIDENLTQLHSICAVNALKN